MRLAWSLLPPLSLFAACFNPEDPVGTGGDTSGGSGTDTVTDTDPSATVTGTTPGTSASTTMSTTDTETTDDPTVSTTVDPDSTGDSTGTPVACEGSDGTLDSDCPGEAPFCLGGECVGCDDLADGAGACAGVDPATPVCNAGTCSACENHSECGSGACRRRTGECFSEPNRLWVDNTDPNCGNGTGAEDSPMCLVTTAMSVIDAQPGTEPWAVFVAGSPNPYPGTIDSGSGRPLAIIGPSQGLAATIDGGAGHALDLWAQTPETYVAHVTMTSSNQSSTIRGGGECELDLADVALTDSGTAIVTNGCDIVARRAFISGNYDTNVVVSTGGTFTTDEAIIADASTGMIVDGSATLQRTRVFGHYVGGGITVEGGSLRMINSIVHQNEYANDGIAMNGGNLELNYSTIVGAVTCSNGAVGSIRNSIVLGHMSEAGLVCANANVDYSVVNAGVGQGVGNVMAGAADLPMIFVNSAQYGGDYHVVPDSLPAGVAMWQDGDPIVDFDGEERPGDEDYAGADIP